MSLEQDQQTPDSARIADEKVKAQKKAALDQAASGISTAPVNNPSVTPSLLHTLTHNPITNFIGDMTGGGNIVQGVEKIAHGNVMGGLGNIALGVGTAGLDLVGGEAISGGLAAARAARAAEEAVKAKDVLSGIRGGVAGISGNAGSALGSNLLSTAKLGAGLGAGAIGLNAVIPGAAAAQTPVTAPQAVAATPQALQQMVTNFNATNPQLGQGGLTTEQARQYGLQRQQADIAYQQLLQNAGLQSQIAQQQYQQGINQTNQGASGNTIATRAMLAGTGMDTSPGIADATMQNIQDVAGYQNKLATTAYGQEQKQRALASAQAGRNFAFGTNLDISNMGAQAAQNQADRAKAIQDLINQYALNGGK